MKKNYLIYYIALVLLILLFAFSGEAQATENSKINKTIAILPFQINSSKDLTYLAKGMAQMLNSRLSWHQKVKVISEIQIKNQIPDIEHISTDKLISKVASQTHSDFVFSGSITELSGSFSIDTKVYDIKNKRYMVFFEHSKKIDNMIKKTDHIAALINKKVFDRTTVSWKKMDAEKQEYINRLKRQNPENLIRSRQNEEDEESYGWQIWKYLF